jgi:hypothetical protein
VDGERDVLVERALELIGRLAEGSRDDVARDALLLDIARFQAVRVEPYRRLVRSRGVDPAVARAPGELPAIPTDVCRVARVAAHGPEADARVFLTSGTTSGARGAHALRDLSLYDAAARAEAARALFPDRRRLRCVSLIPAEDEAPESSLAYMAARFQGWFFEGRAPDAVWRGGRLDAARLCAALDEAAAQGEPVCLLGTSFAFVFAEDELGERRFALPAGSRIMQTGGFKGRSREVDPAAMRAMLALRYGVPDAWIVAEYGMTELSSQMYETTLAEAIRGGVSAGPRRLAWPGWVRVDVRDPETLAPLPGDAVGLLRIEDAANVDTLWAVQTSDLARRAGDDGIVLLGRAPGATPRGCSLAIEEALGGAGGR